MLCGLLACTAFTACDGDVHRDEYFPGTWQESRDALVVGLRSETRPEHLSLHVFDSDGRLALRRGYTDPRALGSDYFPLEAGSYTVMVVAGVPEGDLPEAATPPSLAVWLDGNRDAYPGLLTASRQAEVEGVTRVLLVLGKGTGGMTFTRLRLLLEVPDKYMPDYVPTRAAGAGAGDAWRLRCVAEVLRRGTGERVLRHAALCTPLEDGRYAVELPLQPGGYDIRLWADRTDDGTTGGRYYDTDDLRSVTVRTDGYTAGEATDTKDACYANVSVNVSGGAQDESVKLERPFARYRIIATDVEEYEALRQKEGYPPVEELLVTVTYTGYFPTGFDAASGKPNDARTGIAYTTRPVAADGFDAAKARQVGADFVLANGGDSFVTATVRVTDPATGRAVSAVQDVRIPYRRGYLTTITGKILTAGNTPGGVTIDPGWDEIIVPF